MRISDWSSDVCSSDLDAAVDGEVAGERLRQGFLPCIVARSLIRIKSARPGSTNVLHGRRLHGECGSFRTWRPGVPRGWTDPPAAVALDRGLDRKSTRLTSSH